MARLIYTLLITLLSLLAPLYLLWRGRRQPDYLRHWGERYGRYPAPASRLPAAPTLWLHCVSVGETRAAQALIKLLQTHHPHAQLLLTHTTPTGRATSLELFGDSITRCYLPYDTPWAVAAFLDHYRPDLGMIMETEIWPNLIAACQHRQIPLVLANARLSERSARGYERILALTRPALQGFSVIAAQTPADAVRLERLSGRAVELTGNLKFDNQPAPELLARGQAWRQQWGGRRVLLAASTRTGEEALLLAAWARLAPANTLLVLVPRHPQRFDEVAALITAQGLRWQRRSATLTPASDCQVWLGDSMGEMHAYYACADLAFIGGSLLDHGCQNLIEACAVGVPVLLGPSTYNFAEAAQAALQQGAARQVGHADELMQLAGELMDSPHIRAAMAAAGLQFASQHRGASARTLAIITRLLSAPASSAC